MFAGPPWYSIVRREYRWDQDGSELVDQSYWLYGSDSAYYDFEEKNGEGMYYQGWSTWGLTNDGKPGLVTLAERDDVRDSLACGLAYDAARNIHFRLDVVEYKPLDQKQLEQLRHKSCPRCKATPYHYNIRTADALDKWVQCKQCGLTGGDGDGDPLWGWDATVDHYLKNSM